MASQTKLWNKVFCQHSDNHNKNKYFTFFWF